MPSTNDNRHGTMSDLQASVDYILAKTNNKIPTIALQLGSGLNGIADSLSDRISIPYEEIPGFPTTSAVSYTHLTLPTSG